MSARKKIKTGGSNAEAVIENDVEAESNKRQKLLCLLDFIKLEPPNFFGTESPEEAEQWLLNIEQEFEALEFSDGNLKLSLAEFQLKDVASDRWLGAKVDLERHYGTISWDRFKLAFRKHYFPRLKRDKAREFWNLKQENTTVEEYSRKFSSLLMYVPDIASDNEEKIQHFLEGLNPDIYFRVSLAANGDKSFDDVLNTAYLIESVNRETEASYSECSNQSSSPVGCSCTHCGGRHPRERCFRLLGACFACGQVGHLARDCPNRDNDPTGGQPF